MFFPLLTKSTLEVPTGACTIKLRFRFQTWILNLKSHFGSIKLSDSDSDLRWSDSDQISGLKVVFGTIKQVQIQTSESKTKNFNCFFALKICKILEKNCFIRPVMFDSDSDDENTPPPAKKPRPSRFLPRNNFCYLTIDEFKERFRFSRTGVEDLLQKIGPALRPKTDRNCALSAAQRLLLLK